MAATGQESPRRGGARAVAGGKRQRRLAQTVLISAALVLAMWSAAALAECNTNPPFPVTPDYHLDAACGVTADVDGRISMWESNLGTALDGKPFEQDTYASRPTLVEGAFFNGHPGVFFDPAGPGQFLTTTGTTPSKAFFAVVSVTDVTTPNQDTLWGVRGADAGIKIAANHRYKARVDTDDYAYAQGEFRVNDVPNGLDFDLNVTHVIKATRGSSFFIYNTGLSDTGASIGGTVAATWFHGYVAEVLVYGELPTTQQSTAIIDYLRNKYGVQVCGNGVVDSSEDENCDDGNTDNGDCCSSTCQIEPSGTACDVDGNECTLDTCNFVGECVANPELPVCGNDVVECGEACDGDGGNVEGCCAPDCSEIYVNGTGCDVDGNPCTVDMCDSEGQCINFPSDATCGNGVVDCGEDCDPGPDDPNDCCTSECFYAEEFAGCDVDNETCTFDYCDAAGFCTPRVEEAVCGNGLNECGEECDDGNLDSGDCCSPSCTFEPANTTCDGDNDVCTMDACNGNGTCVVNTNEVECGNGILECGEECDDGGTVAGDCCSPLCTFEPVNATCNPDSDLCTEDYCNGLGECILVNSTAVCGNGVVECGEECDEGDVLGGDCCAPWCQFEPFETPCAADADECTPDFCNGAGACVAKASPSVCGNGVLECGEDCDEGDDNGNGCCTTECSYEPPSTPCDVDGDVCTEDVCNNVGTCLAIPYTGSCGNGALECGEDCDDGNLADGDCCTSSCAYDPALTSCDLDDDVCTPDVCDGTGVCLARLTLSVCGNGALECGEDCDPGPDDPDDCCSATCQYVVEDDPCDTDGDVCTEDYCDASGTCVFKPSPSVCGNQVVECGETCDPLVSLPGLCCDPDCQLLESSTVCRGATSECDAVETCDGMDSECPDDALEPNGFGCAQTHPCSINSICDGSGMCVEGERCEFCDLAWSGSDGSLSGNLGDGTGNGGVGIEIFESAEPGTAGYVISLSASGPPSSAYDIDFTVSDPSEATLSISSVTVDGTSWESLPDVEIYAVDDDINDGHVVFEVTISSSLCGAAAETFVLTNVDDDVPYVVLTWFGNASPTAFEGGSSPLLGVALATEPSQPVVVVLSFDRHGFAVDGPGPTPATLSFNATTWSTFQNVSIVAVEEMTAGGNFSLAVIATVNANATGDATYRALPPINITLGHVDNDQPAVLLSLAADGPYLNWADFSASLVVREAGPNATIWIKLSTAPEGTVYVDLSSGGSQPAAGPPGGGGGGAPGKAALPGLPVFVSTLQLAFDASSWSDPQVVTVSSADNDVEDVAILWALIGSTSASAEDAYSALPSITLRGVLVDDDFLRNNGLFDLTPGGGNSTANSTAEPDSDMVLTIKLNGFPVEDGSDTITVLLASSNADEANVVPPVVTFKADSFWIPQEVVIEAVDDSYADGDVAYDVTAAALGVEASLSLVNVDDEAAGFTVSMEVNDTVANAGVVGATSELGTPIPVSIRINAQPRAIVNLRFTVTNTDEAAVSGGTASVGPLTWENIIVVDVTGLPDDVNHDGDQEFNLVITVTSQDDNYDGMVIEVPFVNRDILFPRVGVWNTTVSPMEGWAVEVIDGDGYEEGMVVLVHGMPVTHLSVISATWIRFRTPAMTNASRAETYNDVVMRNVDGGFIDLPGHVYYTERCPYVGQEGPSEEECTVCREGADCAGGDRIRPTEGYWNPGETSGLLLKCRPAARCVGFLSLANQSACADGYDSMMCGSCAPEYWPKAGLCAECPGSPFPLLLIVIDVVLMLLLVGALVGASYRILSAAGLSIVLLQFIRFVPLYAAGTLDDNKRGLLYALRIFTGEGLRMPGCVTGEATFLIEYISLVAFFVAFGVLLLVLLPCTRLILASTGKKGDDEEVTRVRYVGRRNLAISYYLFFWYAALTYHSIRAWSCQAPDASLDAVVFTETGTVCFDGEHWPAAILAAIVLLLVSLGVPIGVLVFLFKRSGQGVMYGPPFVRAWYALHGPYKRGRFFYKPVWFMAVLLVFAAVNIVPMIEYDDLLWVCLIASAPILLLIVFLIAVRPFFGRWRTIVSVVALLIAALVLWMPYLADVSPDLVKVLKWVCFLAPLLLCCCLFALVGLRRSRDGTQRISDDDWLWLAHTESSSLPPPPPKRRKRRPAPPPPSTSYSSVSSSSSSAYSYSDVPEWSSSSLVRWRRGEEHFFHNKKTFHTEASSGISHHYSSSSGVSWHYSSDSPTLTAASVAGQSSVDGRRQPLRRLHERPVQSFVDEGRFNTSSDDSPPPPPADTKAKKKNKAANKKKAPKTKAKGKGKAKAKAKGKVSTVPSSVAESTVDGGDQPRSKKGKRKTQQKRKSDGKPSVVNEAPSTGGTYGSDGLPAVSSASETTVLGSSSKDPAFFNSLTASRDVSAFETEATTMDEATAFPSVASSAASSAASTTASASVSVEASGSSVLSASRSWGSSGQLSGSGLGGTLVSVSVDTPSSASAASAASTTASSSTSGSLFDSALLQEATESGSLFGSLSGSTAQSTEQFSQSSLPSTGVSLGSSADHLPSHFTETWDRTSQSP